MEELEDYKIWFPYEVFYIESMLTLTSSSMQSQTALSEILNCDFTRENNNQDIVIDLCQGILNCAASISRYFWPSSKDKIHKLRGQRLREAFVIVESNPLKDRTIRNFIEHFDEKLDLFLSSNIAGSFFPVYVGIRPKNPEITFFFRAYFLDDHVFKALNIEYEIMPIIDELIRIHNLLVKFSSNGGRLPTKLSV